MPSFRLFGPAHLAALGLTAAAAAALVRLVRGTPAARTPVRLGLAALLIGATGGFLAATARTGRLNVWDVVPLHLCDFLILVAVFGLLRRGGVNPPRLSSLGGNDPPRPPVSPLAAELLWFWGMSGTLLAMITPDLWETWPDWRFVTYFALHGGVVVSAVVLTLGFGVPPRPGAPWRVWALTNLYAAVVGIVDVAFRKNFLYLRYKPGAETLVDWLGPWPVYILVVDVVALVLFLLLDRPFAAARRACSARSRPPIRS